MKNTICKFAMMIGLSALGTASLSAQEMKETGSIPFDFQVSGQKLTAGTYTVVRDTVGTSTTMLHIRNKETRKAVFLPIPINEPGVSGQSKLVFRKYGERYFLAEVWFPEESTGHVYPVSREEKEVSTAMNKTTPELTFVAMR
jgi:hypothetical protein